MVVKENDTYIEKSRIFSSRLEEWSLNNNRAFPWRESQNLFHLLVAEILLRKTQAARVLPVFNEFQARYQGPSDVLDEQPEFLMELLGSLGLKHRVQWLIELCSQLVEEYGGTVPSDYANLLEIKGIGPYTASMLLCLGNIEALPPVDNNIARLVSRVFDVQRVGDTRREKHVILVLQVAFHHGNPRRTTLAMLDLAGLLCKASRPRCVSCPLQDICCWNQRQIDVLSLNGVLTI